MCRAGGRRCPSQHDPEKIRLRNEKRRAKYAAEHAQTPPQPALTPWLPSEYTITHNPQTYPGLTLIPCEGELVTQHYYAENQVEKHDSKNMEITPQLKTLLGFSEPDEELEIVSFPESVSVQKASELSSREMNNLSEEERKAVHLFSGDEYLRINSSLYGKQYEGELLKNIETPYSSLEEITSVLDSAIKHGSLGDRIVYRGAPPTSTRFNGNVETYVTNNYKVGEEITFSGYQSSTLSPTMATKFAQEGGVVFQIRASKGLNITGISKYSVEEEVMLPRDSTYVVVGVYPNFFVETPDTTTVAHVVQLLQIENER